jgi:methyl-accepting chemotaxis protein
LLRNLNIGPRLAIGFAVVILFMLTIVFTAGNALNGMRAATRDIVDGDIAKTELAHQAQDLASRNAAKLFQLFVAKDQAGRTGLYGDIDKNKAALDTTVKKLAGLSAGTEEAALLDALKQSGAEFTKAFGETADLIEADSRDQAVSSLNGRTLPALEKLVQATQAAVAFEKKLADAAVAESEQRFFQVNLVMWGASGVAILASVLLGLLLTRSILLPIQHARKAVGDMAQGNLAAPLADAGKDEVAVLLGSLEAMRQSLREILWAVADQAGKVTMASSQLSGSAREIADSSSQQSGLAEQIVGSLDDLTASARQVAQSAGSTRQQTEQGVELAERGQTLIHQAAGTVVNLNMAVSASATDVASLKQRSEDIAGMVRQIREIADQTNLIALNAAIEAARAGEYGRGFAVVADEVRALSVRASQATSDIAKLIETMKRDTQSAVQGMEDGSQDMQYSVTLVQGIVEPLSELAARSRDSFASLGELVQVAERQSQAADAMLGQVRQISGMAAANRDRVHQAAATSAELDAMAGSLRAAVERFRL